jgi:hypothetical protein
MLVILDISCNDPGWIMYCVVCGLLADENVRGSSKFLFYVLGFIDLSIIEISTLLSVSCEISA